LPPDDSNSAPSNGTPGVTLMVRPPRDVLADDLRTQRLWLSLQQRAWRSLAVVAASEEIGTVGVANSLAKIAWWYTGQPSIVFDMRDLSLRLLDHQLREMTSHVRAADRVFVALRGATENPTTAPIARATDAAVLCVALGKTGERDAERTLQAIGRDHFIGAILVPRNTPSEVAAMTWNEPTTPPGHE
jgi:hypothetical protein